MTDIICGKTGRHYSSWEALQECRKYCKDCPYDRPIKSHQHSKNTTEDTLTADDIDRILGTGKYTKQRHYNNHVREYRTKDGRTFRPYITNEYSTPKSTTIITYFVLIIIILLILGVIGGAIYGLRLWIT